MFTADSPSKVNCSLYYTYTKYLVRSRLKIFGANTQVEHSNRVTTNHYRYIIRIFYKVYINYSNILLLYNIHTQDVLYYIRQ